MAQLVDVKAGVFREYVKNCFTLAAEAFARDPSANRWTDLKVAMWAWQSVHGMTPGVLLDAAHEHLSAIAAMGKGDNNFEES